MGKQSWNQPAPALPAQGAKGAAIMELPPAEEVAQVIYDVLSSESWRLWLHTHDGHTTIIIKGESQGVGDRELRIIKP